MIFYFFHVFLLFLYEFNRCQIMANQIKTPSDYENFENDSSPPMNMKNIYSFPITDEQLDFIIQQKVANDETEPENERSESQNFDSPALIERSSSTQSVDGDKQIEMEKQNSELSEISSKMKHLNSQSSTISDTLMSTNEEEAESLREANEMRRERKPDDALLLEFIHNQQNDRIKWIDYPNYRKSDKYRLIDEAAERSFITARNFGFVNEDSDSNVMSDLINYVENSKKGYEVTNFQFSKHEWNKKPDAYRIDACDYLLNDSIKLRKLGIIYDSSQPAKVIRVQHITVRFDIENLTPRRYKALACPALHRKSSRTSILYVAPVTYLKPDADEYVFIFTHDDRYDHPLHVRLMSLSRLGAASSKEVVQETEKDERIDAIDHLWWYGDIKNEKQSKSAAVGEKLDAIDELQEYDGVKNDKELKPNDMKKRLDAIDKLEDYDGVKDDKELKPDEMKKRLDAIDKLEEYDGVKDDNELKSDEMKKRLDAIDKLEEYDGVKDDSELKSEAMSKSPDAVNALLAHDKIKNDDQQKSDGLDEISSAMDNLWWFGSSKRNKNHKSK